MNHVEIKWKTVAFALFVIAVVVVVVNYSFSSGMFSLFRCMYNIARVCRTDLMALDRLLDLFAHRFLCLVPFLSVHVIPTCSRLSWPAVWSTF